MFSPDGGQMVTPENDFEHGIGAMVVRDARSLDVVGEFPSAGGVAFDRRTREFVVTNGAGAAMHFDSATGTRRGPVRRFPGLRWDNHLTAV